MDRGKNSFKIDVEKLDREKIEEIIGRLKTFESMVEDVLEKQVLLTKELEDLKKTKGVKSYQFREVMGRKLTNTAIIALLEQYHLL